jgi:hypothetical protein
METATKEMLPTAGTIVTAKQNASNIRDTSKKQGRQQQQKHKLKQGRQHRQRLEEYHGRQQQGRIRVQQRGHRQQQSQNVCAHLGCPRNEKNKIFGSNRNKPKQDLFRICFGLFRETKKNFRFVSVFRTFIETTETNRTVSKQTETTQNFLKNIYIKDIIRFC